LHGGWRLVFVVGGWRRDVSVTALVVALRLVVWFQSARRVGRKTLRCLKGDLPHMVPVVGPNVLR